MSDFTDRMIAAGVTASIAASMEADLLGKLAAAKSAKVRLNTTIDQKQGEVDALKAQRQVHADSIDDIRTTLGDPNA